MAKNNKKQLQIMLLREIAIYLEGFKRGNGNMPVPLGNAHLTELWNIIYELKNK